VFIKDIIMIYCVVCEGPTMKLRRGVVLKMYQKTIDAFYAPAMDAHK